jgi:hypothetical protein
MKQLMTNKSYLRPVKISDQPLKLARGEKITETENLRAQSIVYQGQDFTEIIS